MNLNIDNKPYKKMLCYFFFSKWVKKIKWKKKVSTLGLIFNKFSSISLFDFGI